MTNLTPRPSHDNYSQPNRAYQADELDYDTRLEYLDFNTQKKKANQWLTAQNLPFIARFKPNKDHENQGPSIHSHMNLKIQYVLPNGEFMTIKSFRPSNNFIKVTQWDDIIRLILNLWDRQIPKRQDYFLDAAKEAMPEYEANLAYEQAYA